jgi:fucose permease
MAGIVFSIISLIFVYFFRSSSSELLLLSLVALGLFFSFSWPNLIASILDITLPELRASAAGIFLFFQAMGAFVSPFIVAIINRMIGLIGSITWVCIAAWGICLILFFSLTRSIPNDIEQFRKHMAYRSFLEMRMQNMITQRKK